jgi:hypothetical protein
MLKLILPVFLLTLTAACAPEPAAAPEKMECCCKDKKQADECCCKKKGDVKCKKHKAKIEQSSEK